MTTPSPSFRFSTGASSTGPWTDGTVGAPMDATAAQWVKVSLGSTASVNSFIARITTADDTTLAAGVPAVTLDAVLKTAVFQLPSRACTIIVAVQINGGVDSTGPQASYTTSSAIHVLTDSGLRLIAVGETTESSSAYGWTPKVNLMIAANNASLSPVDNSSMLATRIGRWMVDEYRPGADAYSVINRENPLSASETLSNVSSVTTTGLAQFTGPGPVRGSRSWGGEIGPWEDDGASGLNIELKGASALSPFTATSKDFAISARVYLHESAAWAGRSRLIFGKKATNARSVLNVADLAWGLYLTTSAGGTANGASISLYCQLSTGTITWVSTSADTVRYIKEGWNHVAAETYWDAGASKRRVKFFLNGTIVYDSGRGPAADTSFDLAAFSDSYPLAFGGHGKFALGDGGFFSSSRDYVCDVQLWQGCPSAASFTFTADASSNRITCVTNARDVPTGTPIGVWSSGGSVPSPLVAGTVYYAIRVTSSVYQLATSYANAIAGTCIDLTTAGSGTLYAAATNNGVWATELANTTGAP